MHVVAPTVSSVPPAAAQLHADTGAHRADCTSRSCRKASNIRAVALEKVQLIAHPILEGTGLTERVDVTSWYGPTLWARPRRSFPCTCLVCSSWQTPV